MQYGENSSCKASMEDYLSPLDYTPLGEITVLNKQETMWFLEHLQGMFQMVRLQSAK